jgi:K+-sensing histidine kinase KdpD
MHLDPMDIGSVAESIIEKLRKQQPARNVDVRIHKDLHANADARFMDIVLTNLIGNAWKFTSKTTSAVIEVGAEVYHGKQVFFVRDTGAGFESKLAKSLFLPFKRGFTNRISRDGHRSFNRRQDR